MNRNEKIQYILERESLYDRDELRAMSDEELDLTIADIDDDSDMYPNGRDYDAEDEDWP